MAILTVISVSYDVDYSLIDQFTLESSYGNLELSDTSARSASFSLGDGDADMDSVTLEQVDFDTSYGDVTMKNSSFGAVTLHAGDGDVTCENNTFTGNCEFTLSYGDAFFRLDDQQKAALSMEFQTDYGDITIDPGNVRAHPPVPAPPRSRLRQ